VEAIREDFKIKCRKIELFYENPDDGDNPGEGQFNILELIATGNVILSGTDGSTATAEKAVYNKNDEKVVLKGDPVVVEYGEDFVEGATITYYLEEDLYRVESPEDGRTRAVWSPKNDER
jgi:lipopolysaccharide transport protein LptA